MNSNLLIENIIGPEITPYRKAALYYKTEPFFRGVDYSHTNNWEITQAIELLNQRGFSVDLIDRNNNNWNPSKKYDLFLGLGVGNAGRNFVKHANASQSPISVLLAMGPQPDTSNHLVLQRYEMFEKRTGIKAPPMRTVSEVIGDNFKKIINKTDYIFNIGEKNSRSYESFLPYGKPILNFYPAISPDVVYNKQRSLSRDRKSFLCFVGNGFICKGVDLMVESFLKNQEKTLHICGPQTEPAFFQCYQKRIEASPNIKYHGFITPGEDVFNSLAAECSFVVFHSAAESCCTSIATAMKAGLVPIINPWTSIITEDFVLSEEGNLIEHITTAVNQASELSDNEYQGLVDKTLNKASLFSQDSFTKSYFKALDAVI
jgi:glycosyltransferase involved in cell wall biosynthesis